LTLSSNIVSYINKFKPNTYSKPTKMLPHDPYPEYPDFEPEGSPTPAIPGPPFSPKPVGDDEVWDDNSGGNNDEDEFSIL
jgi:hypothetical protein